VKPLLLDCLFLCLLALFLYSLVGPEPWRDPYGEAAVVPAGRLLVWAALAVWVAAGMLYRTVRGR
jgi:hypothetical protein